MTTNDISNYARSFIGVPYCYGGNNPLTGFDCSALVVEILKAFGVLYFHEDLSANDLCLRLMKSYGPGTEIKEGSILFFGTGVKISHTGYALSDKLMIEAGGGDSGVLNLQTAAAKNAFVRIRPIAMRKDYVCCVSPKYVCIEP